MAVHLFVLVLCYRFDPSSVIFAKSLLFVLLVFCGVFSTSGAARLQSGPLPGGILCTLRSELPNVKGLLVIFKER